MPVQWASTHNNLGNALRIFGETAGDTARIEEAVAAYRAALEVRTREALPTAWATTQNNLAMALKSLGQLRGDETILMAAHAAAQSALQVQPDGRAYMDTLKQVEQALASLNNA
jgi:tetratricopeptide (TPR) repeat protein